MIALQATSYENIKRYNYNEPLTAYRVSPLVNWHTNNLVTGASSQLFLDPPSHDEAVLGDIGSKLD